MSDVADEESGVEVKKTLCWPSPGCHCNCGLLVRVKDNKILSIRGNPEFPYNRGSVCAERVPHFREWLDHPDQLVHPLKRQGERGENRWERISWEQALDEIAAKLQAIKAGHGAESLSTIEGAYRSDFYPIRARFLNLFGNPANVGASGTCSERRHGHAGFHDADGGTLPSGTARETTGQRPFQADDLARV